jgi:hypothetical protein
LIGLQRLDESTNSYLPSTLPPRLYQTNQFTNKCSEANIEQEAYGLTVATIPATAQEIQLIADEDKDELNITEAVESLRTRSSRAVQYTSKAKENKA